MKIEKDTAGADRMAVVTGRRSGKLLGGVGKEGGKLPRRADLNRGVREKQLADSRVLLSDRNLNGSYQKQLRECPVSGQVQNRLR